MNDLPLNGRNVMQLLRLTPGTLSTPGTFNQAATRPETGGELISASGGRGNSTTFVLDGGIHEDPYTEVANVLPNPDAVQEFSFQTNNYGAKFAGRGGGVVNIVTRSGSNAFHGSLFEYLRNGEMNARNFFAATERRTEAQSIWVLAGRSDRPNRTFFFGSWQGTQVRSLPATSTAVVPTAAQRRATSAALSTQLHRSATRASHSRQRIPAAHLDPIALRVLELVPLPKRRRTAPLPARRQANGQPVPGARRSSVQHAPPAVGPLFLRPARNPDDRRPENMLTAVAHAAGKARALSSTTPWTVSHAADEHFLSYNRASNIAHAAGLSGSSRVRHQRADHVHGRHIPHGRQRVLQQLL